MIQKGDATFPTTRWTLIARARSEDESVARRALNEVCAQYHYPLYCFIRRSGLDHHDAEDALHDFFAKLLRLEVFAGAMQEMGRLRGLLVTALRRFVANWQRNRTVREREVSSDAPFPGAEDEARYQKEQFIESETPERTFERKWGHELLVRVYARLRESYAKKGRVVVFGALRPALEAGGTLRDGDVPGLAAKLGITENALRGTLVRLLAEFREILKSEVWQTVGSHAEVADEIAHLQSVFQKH
jgi:DNA-directed RNA polymerase specialized sigma24 family protein